MKNFRKLLSVSFLGLMLASCSDKLDHVSLDFTKDQLGGVEVKNLSGAESYGRWTAGKVTTITFDKDFPEKFTLNLVAVDAIAPDSGQAFLVEVANQSENFIIYSGKKSFFTKTFENVPAGTKELKITTPYPTSPAELGINGDVRKLGAAFSSLEIIPVK